MNNIAVARDHLSGAFNLSDTLRLVVPDHAGAMNKIAYGFAGNSIINGLA